MDSDSLAIGLLVGLKHRYGQEPNCQKNIFLSQRFAARGVDSSSPMHGQNLQSSNSQDESYSKVHCFCFAVFSTTS